LSSLFVHSGEYQNGDATGAQCNLPVVAGLLNERQRQLLAAYSEAGSREALCQSMGIGLLALSELADPADANSFRRMRPDYIVTINKRRYISEHDMPILEEYVKRRASRQLSTRSWRKPS
jgi:hypothetical protein